MKIVPKPQGYELRDKRSEKAMVIAWYERDELKGRELKWNQAGDSDTVVRLMQRCFGRMMGWD